MRSVRLFRNEKVIRVFRPFWDSSRSRKFALASKPPEKTEPDPYEGNFSFTECDQYAKVTVVGAAGRVGRTLSLLLKTCPLVDHLCLFDIDKSVKGIGVDISHIDTNCCVSYVCGMRNIQHALEAPDVVVIAAGCPTSPTLFGKRLFDKNAPIIAGLSEACARFCPKACIVLITSPINSLLPVMGEVYQIITNRIPSRKLFGLTTLDVVRANTFVAEVVRKDPNNVIVPVIGGTSQETIVPVFSQMKPCCKIKKGEMVALTECLKRAEANLADCQNCGTRGASSLSTAYAGFRFTSSLVKALKGAEDIIECAFVKSSIIPELEYLASPLKLGLRGIEHNFGYPQLSDFELVGLEQAAASLILDINMGKDFVAGIEDTIRKGAIWKRLSEESGKEMISLSVADDRLKPLQDCQEVRDSEAEKIYKQIQKRRKTREEMEKAVAVSRVSSESPVVDEFPLYSQSVSGSSLCFSSNVNVEQSQDNYTEKDLKDEQPQEETLNPSVSLSAPKQQNCFDFRKREDYNLLTPKAFQKVAMRGIHTENKNNSLHDVRRKLQKYKTYLIEDRKKTMLAKPLKVAKMSNEINVKYKAKVIEQSSRKSPWDIRFENARYKVLNAAAKQKFRSFNSQKKVSPSASVLLLLDREKRDKEKEGKSLISTSSGIKEKEREKEEPVVEKGKEEGVKDEEEEDEGERKTSEDCDEENELMIARKTFKDEASKHRDYILKQLQELRRENDELKKKLFEVVKDRKMETALQIQSEHLEMERTKLKACWLIMSSTIDAFSNFCRKFTGVKNDAKLLPPAKAMEEEEEQASEEDEYEDARDVFDRKEDKNRTEYDARYYNFWEKMMEDQECEKKRTRMRK